MTASIAPYGTWRSPISATLVATAGIALGWVQARGDDLYWVEMRPTEGGRYVIVRRTPDGQTTDVTPAGFNARTLVHEYGGGAYVVSGSAVFFSNFDDQRVYRQPAGGGEPQPITPPPASPRALRYADGRVTPDGHWLICVRQSHHASGEVVNDLVAVATSGAGEPVCLAAGHDFYSSPRVSPDGRWLVWFEWDQPQMPWDGTELWRAELLLPGEESVAAANMGTGRPRLESRQKVAGGPNESVVEPSWDAAGRLHFVSDRSGWWNIYRCDERTDAEGAGGTGQMHPLHTLEAEFAKPHWVFGDRHYDHLADGRIAAIYGIDGIDHLGIIDARTGSLRELSTGLTSMGYLCAAGDSLYLVAGGPRSGNAVISVEPATGEPAVVRAGSALNLDPDLISEPQPIHFPTTGGAIAHALYYPPRNPSFRGSADERPPLVVDVHGGPTSAAEARLILETQFWTSRGFGYVSVNYGGSSNYGRAYRERLKGNWGIVDVDDCIACARYLAERGDIDGERTAIRGGSAGGFTTLAALVFHDSFATGTSYFGVAALEEFVGETHKYEARYLDGLLGPWPEARQIYHDRSPVNFADRVSRPILLLQGLEDAIVPPAQAEVFVAALEAKGLPYAYLAFEGEQHGFRRSPNIARALEAELSFYGAVLGFTPADGLPPLEIHNADKLKAAGN
jgi:dipeptidyl aminopeptidase/acylaminoacyl peptidase